MALSSVLEIVTQACDELGLPRPGTSGVTGASTPQERQLLSLFNTAGRELVNTHDWSSLIATATITTATASSSYTLPTDFQRIVADTGWDKTNFFPMAGNISLVRHQFWLSSSVVAPTTRKEFRLFLTNAGGTVYVQPAPQVAEELSFLYITKNWITGSGGDADLAALDADAPKFSPDLMVKELKWRFRAAKGLDANALKMECDNLRDQLIARDQGTGMIDMGGPQPIAPADYLTPDGNWTLT